MRKLKFLGAGGIGVIVLLIAVFGIVSANGTSTIDFEGLSEGQIVSSVSSGSGISGAVVGGSVSVLGIRPGFGPNQAMIFDATCLPGGTPVDCTGGDTDLFNPGLGNVLIVSENNDSSDPDDADLIGEMFEFDFSGFGPGVVTVDSIDAMDIEAGQGEGGAKIEVFSGGPGGVLLASVGIPDTGNGGLINVAVGVSNVDFMRVTLNGSGAIDNIQITTEDESNPAIDIEKFTLVQAISVDGDACDIVGKPAILTMMYTGDDNPTSHTQDPSKAVITGSTLNTDPVHIVATNKSDPNNSKAKIWFEGDVALGGTFDIDANAIGRNRLSSNTYVLVYNADGSVLLQSIKFHTSCSQPLNLGDQFGSALLVGLVGEIGTAQPPSTTATGLGSDADAAPGPQAEAGDTIIWSYVVTNTGDVDLTGVTVEDDQGVTVTCPLTALAVGQYMTCTGTGTAVAGQYANIGTTSGTAPDSTVVTDQDPSHYHADVPQGDQCDTSGKPVILTMTYTGDQNPTSHTQDAGKVVITGLTGNATPVHIIATNKSDPNSRKAKIWFDGTVALGETFNIDAKALGRDRLSSKTFVLVYDGTTLLQSINFHTSCSQPLSIGDQFGSAQLTVYAGQADLGLTKKHKKGHH